ncbi:hypothetical protein ACP4OV_026986 [Aristida adscensionis]
MAASQRPRTRTESTFTTEMARATHVFRITGCSLQKGLSRNQFIRSGTFAAGGHDWCIRYYPDGIDEPGTKDYVSVYLELQSKDAGARAIFDLRLLDHAAGESVPVFSKAVAAWFQHGHRSQICGAGKFKTRSKIEASAAWLRDDCLVIECDVTVILQSSMHETPPATADLAVQVPPSDLSNELGKLFDSKEGMDVTFEVKGQVFHAHKVVFAMRSPVFKAELYGLMRHKETRNIKIENMQPAVFRALLHFVYKDSLPPMDDLEEDQNKEMIKDLLAAADKFSMERMKLMCESILCNRLGTYDSVATTLAFAEKHNCSKLKDACIGFITSSGRLDHVMACKGYDNLKRACPAVQADILDKEAKSCKI